MGWTAPGHPSGRSAGGDQRDVVVVRVVGRGVGSVKLAAGPVEKISTSLGEVGVLGRLVEDGVVGTGTDDVDGATDVDWTGATVVGDTAADELATWLEAAVPESGADEARLAVPATAVMDCAREQSSRGTGVWWEACTCITSPSRASANTEHDRVPNRAMNESAEYCGAVVRTTLPAATMAARNWVRVSCTLVAEAGGWSMVTRTACVDPLVTTYSQWSLPLPTAAVKPLAVSELISAAEGQLKTFAATSTEAGAEPETAEPETAPLAPAGSTDARLVDLPVPDPLVQAVAKTATPTPMANHHGIDRRKELGGRAGGERRIGVERSIFSLPKRCAPVSGRVCRRRRTLIVSTATPPSLPDG